MPTKPDDARPFALVAPPTENPFTGGHLYNGRVAAALGLEIVRVPPHAIDAWLATRAQPCLLDSLYLPHASPEAIRDGSPVVPLAHFLAHRAPDAAFAARDIVPKLAASAAVIATSAFTARQVEEDVPGARCYVCKPGVERDAEAQPRAAAAPEQARILTVANFEARKGHGDALRCLAQLAELPWRWDIVGDTRAEAGCFEDFAREAERAQLGARVHVHGRLAPDRVRALMREADLFVLPTRYEPYGMVFAESVAAGCPVVAFDCGGVPESVEHGATGLLAALGDLDELRAALAELLTSRATRIRMSQSCRERAFPTWADTAAALAAACADVRARAARRPGSR